MAIDSKIQPVITRPADHAVRSFDGDSNFTKSLGSANKPSTRHHHTENCVSDYDDGD
jgi:hypothetical protein